VAYEIIAIPLTYIMVSFLKQQEGTDIYDDQTNFNPFSFRRTSIEPKKLQ